jgi:hypothetical protein
MDHYASDSTFALGSDKPKEVMRVSSNGRTRIFNRSGEVVFDSESPMSSTLVESAFVARKLSPAQAEAVRDLVCLGSMNLNSIQDVWDKLIEATAF